MRMALLVLMNDLKRIEADGDRRGIETGEDGADVNQHKRSGEDGDRPVEADGPAEGLLIHDENQQERETVAKGGAGGAREKAEQGGFDENELANLAGDSAEIAKQAEFAAAVDDQREKRSGDAHHRDDDSDGFEGVGDGEGAVEDAHGLGADFAVGEEQDASVGGGGENASADGGDACAGIEVNGEIRRRGIGEIAQERVAIHQDGTALARIVVVDVNDAEGGARSGEGKA